MLNACPQPTRRRFLAALCPGWLPLPWRRPGAKIAGVAFRVRRRGRSPRRYLWIHGDERTARDVLLKHLERAAGTAFLTPSNERAVRIGGLLLDPNRMFSRAGAEASFRMLNPAGGQEGIRRALDRLDRDREKFLRAILPPPGGRIVALHNNSRGYSVEDEIPISDRVWLPRRSQPHEFFLATSPEDFARLARSPYNAVLQQKAPPDDDGSLSRLAARRGVRYVNIEAALGEYDQQRAMLAWVEANLP